jgi:hypothetical protein
MPEPTTAAIVGGSIFSGLAQGNAAKQASKAQTQAAQQGVDEQRRQFEAAQQVLSPYVEAGTQAIAGLQPYAQAGVGSLQQQQALLGLLGPEAQQQAIAQIEQGGGFQAQVRQGEEALLQRASATGGLRGGNIQAALAQFRPQMLQQEIEAQYGRLGGMTALGQTTTQNIAQLGQASAAGQATAGLQTGANIANLFGQQGAARAGARLAEGTAASNVLNLPGQFLGMQYGAGVKSPGFDSLIKQFSDQRLKKNVARLGTRSDGLGVYEFEYIWGGGRQIGLMAQEVAILYPEAVGESGGFMTVDYGKV